MKKTKEPQYNILYDIEKKHGRTELGLMINESWNQDPKRTLFTLSRYKFVSKMLSGKDKVLEIGCADAFGTRIVQQSVAELTATDFDPVFIDDIEKRYNENWPFKFFKHNILSEPLKEKYDAVYSLDVLEHIDPKDESKFIENSIRSIKADGVMIIGMPSIESQTYASPQSKEGHVNCKNGDDLKNIMEKYFSNVFLFSMNDEVVHTGYSKMAHYVMVVCCNPIND